MNLIIVLFSLIPFAFANISLEDLATNREIHEGKDISVVGEVTKIRSSEYSSFSKVLFKLYARPYVVNVEYFLRYRDTKLNGAFPCKEGDQATVKGQYKSFKGKYYLGTLVIKEKGEIICSGSNQSETKVSGPAIQPRLNIDLMKKGKLVYDVAKSAMKPKDMAGIDAFLTKCTNDFKTKLKSTEQYKTTCSKVEGIDPTTYCQVCTDDYLKYAFCMPMAACLGGKNKDKEKTCKDKGVLEFNKDYQHQLLKVCIPQTIEKLKKVEKGLLNKLENETKNKPKGD